MASIQNNIAANTAFRNVATSSAGLDKQIAKLSSGFRINRSGDDAAGLAIANKLRAESRSLQQASRSTSPRPRARSPRRRTRRRSSCSARAR